MENGGELRRKKPKIVNLYYNIKLFIFQYVCLLYPSLFLPKTCCFFSLKRGSSQQLFGSSLPVRSSSIHSVRFPFQYNTYGMTNLLQMKISRRNDGLFCRLILFSFPRAIRRFPLPNCTGTYTHHGIRVCRFLSYEEFLLLSDFIVSQYILKCVVNS